MSILQQSSQVPRLHAVQDFLPVAIDQVLMGFTALSYDPGKRFMQAAAQHLLPTSRAADERVRAAHFCQPLCDVLSSAGCRTLRPTWGLP